MIIHRKIMNKPIRELEKKRIEWNFGMALILYIYLMINFYFEQMLI